MNAFLHTNFWIPFSIYSKWDECAQVALHKLLLYYCTLHSTVQYEFNLWRRLFGIDTHMDLHWLELHKDNNIIIITVFIFFIKHHPLPYVSPILFCHWLTLSVYVCTNTIKYIHKFLSMLLNISWNIYFHVLICYYPYFSIFGKFHIYSHVHIYLSIFYFFNPQRCPSQNLDKLLTTQMWTEHIITNSWYCSLFIIVLLFWIVLHNVTSASDWSCGILGTQGARRDSWIGNWEPPNWCRAQRWVMNGESRIAVTSCTKKLRRRGNEVTKGEQGFWGGSMEKEWGEKDDFNMVSGGHKDDDSQKSGFPYCCESATRHRKKVDQSVCLLALTHLSLLCKNLFLTDAPYQPAHAWLPQSRCPCKASQRRRGAVTKKRSRQQRGLRKRSNIPIHCKQWRGQKCATCHTSSAFFQILMHISSLE